MIRSPLTMPCRITDERIPNDPQDAKDETRPEHCECAGDDHDDGNERCALYECDCGHALRDHGRHGCEIERGDGYILGIYQLRRPCSCPCETTPEQIAAQARGIRTSLRIAEAVAALME